MEPHRLVTQSGCTLTVCYYVYIRAVALSRGGMQIPARSVPFRTLSSCRTNSRTTRSGSSRQEFTGPHFPKKEACTSMPEPLSPAQISSRALSARIAAHQSWANTADPAARTAPARQAFRARFERAVDPNGTMNPSELARRAESARKAYYTRLALQSARSRRRRALHATEDATLVTELRFAADAIEAIAA
jgi:hypothetical protein